MSVLYVSLCVCETTRKLDDNSLCVACMVFIRGTLMPLMCVLTDFVIGLGERSFEGHQWSRYEKLVKISLDHNKCIESGRKVTGTPQ